MLRKRYGMYDLTHGLKNTYDARNLETDEGDFAHNFVHFLYSSWFGRFFTKLITNIEKIESLVGEKDVLDNYDTKHIDVVIPNLDHHLVEIEIRKR
jgi:hypothetical protein